MNILALAIVATLSLPLTAPVSPVAPTDVTTRVIITNDPGFDPSALTYASYQAKSHAEQLHAITERQLTR